MDLSAPLSAAAASVAGGNADPARYAIGGIAPRAAIRPASREAAADALRAATRDGLGVVPWGGGVALPFERAPAGYDLALDLSALAAIVEYEPDDLTLTAECGITIAALRQALAAHGQELPLEAAHATRATLGGVLAANASGPRRRLFGAPRDRVLGARYLLGDGSGARTGGKVVKNVAGYGVHRLLCGSRGGLAVILEASLKLQPAPATRTALIYGADAAMLADQARWSPLSRLEPAALCVASAGIANVAGLDSGGAPFVVIAGYEEDAPHAAEMERAVTGALGAPLDRRDRAEVLTLWNRLADLEETPGPRLTLTTADATPAALARVIGGGAAGAAAGGAGGATAGGGGAPVAAGKASYLFHAAAGRLHVWPDAEQAPAHAAEIAHALEESGWMLIDARATGRIEPALPPQVAVRAMRLAIREALDPARRFVAGAAWAGD